MRLEDDGTPPAEPEGSLAAEANSPVYPEPFRERISDWARAPRPTLGPRKAATRSWKRPATDRLEAATDDVDLVKLLDENWFWRSSTASPSLAETVSTSGRTTPYRNGSRASQSQHNSREGSANEDFFTSEPSTSDPFGAVNQAAANGQQRNASDEPISPFEEARSGADGFPSEASSQASSPDAATSRRRGQRTADPTLGDPLGTWAQRVIRFAPGKEPAAGPTHIPGTPETADSHPRSKPDAAGPLAGQDEDHAAVEAAWRWRFNRRWRTEQAKQLDPEFGLDGDDEDGWDTALGYLDACGPDYHLQISRTTSNDRILAPSASLVSLESDCGNILMDDSQKEKSMLKEQADMEATKSIRSLARRARDLYKEQQKIEKDVQTRWVNAKVSMSWAGQHLAAVRIDPYGRFTFILAKVSDRTSAHRLLVRGSHNADKPELMRALNAEVQATCKQHNLAAVTVALLGSGVMEWSQERNHRINIRSGWVEKGGDPAIQTADEVVRLAGVLTRASLPTPNRVTVNGEKLS